MEELLHRVVTSAPGKIILCGEHAVVYGKEAIACCINLRASCTVEVDKTSNTLSIAVDCLDIDRCFSLEKIFNTFKSSEFDAIAPSCMSDKLLQQINNMLDENGSNVVLTGHGQTAFVIIIFLFLSIASRTVQSSGHGVRIKISISDLPIGSGLGSSASFAVSIASAFLVFCKLIPSSQNSWTDLHKKLISDWAFMSEKFVHGRPSGIDNSVATYGQLFTFKGGAINLVDSSVNLRVLVVNSKVSRSTKKLVSGVAERREQHLQVYDKLFESIEAISKEFKEVLMNLRAANVSSDPQQFRNEIVKLEHLIVLNQHLLNAIGVGHPALDRIVTICKSNNLHLKLTGAGGGGCGFALIPPEFQETLLNDTIKQLKHFGFDCWTTSLGGSGVTLHDADDATS